MAANPNATKKKRPLPQWMITIKEQERKLPRNSNGFLESLSGEDRPTTSNSCSQSASEIISETMPFLKYEGAIIYSYNESDCACLCVDILSKLSADEPTIIGFDMEWPVMYSTAIGKGHHRTDRTALIQMCLSEKECYLFHVSCMPSLPKPLASLLVDKRVLLVGVNIEADLWKLERDFDNIKVKPAIDQGTVIDLSKLANVKLKSSERWSLEGLCRNVLRKRLDKDRDLRCGNWSEYPLSRNQQMYACLDAFAGLCLYKCLQLK